jgi:hypothetical protein
VRSPKGRYRKLHDKLLWGRAYQGCLYTGARIITTSGAVQAAEGEKVWSRFTWRGTHQEEFTGIPPTSRAVTLNGMVIDGFVDGKWTESRILMDNLGMMQQLGVIPEPGQPGESEPT